MLFIWAVFNLFLFPSILNHFLVVDGGAATTAKFLASSCGKLFQTEDWIDRGHMEAILPTIEFWDIFPAGNKSQKHDIMLVDVDKHSWNLLVNQVVGLRRSGSGLAENVYAIAYDNSTCGNLVNAGIRCYYSKEWNHQLVSKYQEQTGHHPTEIHVIMMGRMMTTAVALCEGHNVFLSDTDVVFYRDPIQYAFNEVDIMITATAINPKLTQWGGTYFVDQPKQLYTLNNGVVFYRSNAVTKAFALTLAADCLNRLKGHPDTENGFLQKFFNQNMVKNKLHMHPCSKASDPATFQLNLPRLSNAVGECFDCYYGYFPWRSDIVHPPTADDQPEYLKIGVYPMKRFTSYCWAASGKHLCSVFLHLTHRFCTVSCLFTLVPASSCRIQDFSAKCCVCP